MIKLKIVIESINSILITRYRNTEDYVDFMKNAQNEISDRIHLQQSLADTRGQINSFLEFGLYCVDFSHILCIQDWVLVPLKSWCYKV